jgi:chaperonin GroES
MVQVTEAEVVVNGIILPTASQKRHDKATVVAISDAVDWLKVGDSILMDRYGSQSIEQDGETFLVLDVKDVLGVYA